MTNFGWIKQQDSMLKKFLIHDCGVYRGNPQTCMDISCSDCKFCSSCTQDRKDWLESTHESKYKQGDVVVTQDGKFWLVTDDSDDESSIAEVTSRAYLTENLNRLRYDEIAAKIGSIGCIELKNIKKEDI